MKNKAIILVIFTVVIFALGAFVGRLTNKPNPETPIDLIRENNTLKAEIADMRNKAKFNSYITPLKESVEHKYIKSKIKQNEQKNDTNSALVLIRFDRLLTINRANQRGKLVPSTKH